MSIILKQDGGGLLKQDGGALLLAPADPSTGSARSFLAKYTSADGSPLNVNPISMLGMASSRRTRRR